MTWLTKFLWFAAKTGAYAAIGGALEGVSHRTPPSEAPVASAAVPPMAALWPDCDATEAACFFLVKHALRGQEAAPCEDVHLVPLLGAEVRAVTVRLRTFDFTDGDDASLRRAVTEVLAEHMRARVEEAAHAADADALTAADDYNLLLLRQEPAVQIVRHLMAAYGRGARLSVRQVEEAAWSSGCAWQLLYGEIRRTSTVPSALRSDVKTLLDGCVRAGDVIRQAARLFDMRDECGVVPPPSVTATLDAITEQMRSVDAAPAGAAGGRRG